MLYLFRKLSMSSFCSLVNCIDQLTASVCYNRFFPVGYGRGKLAHFRRGKLVHLLSMNKNFQKSIQYFITFSDYISHILSPKQKILLQKRIHGHRIIYICKCKLQ